MSGGSLNYLYRRQLAYSDGADGMGYLVRAVERLEKHHAGTRAAINARALLSGIENLNGLHESLADVFQSIEWMLSGDQGADAVDEAVDTYERT